jgi:hypothetical protein
MTEYNDKKNSQESIENYTEHISSDEDGGGFKSRVFSKNIPGVVVEVRSITSLIEYYDSKDRR